MNTDELRSNLSGLIDRYVTDQATQLELRALLTRSDIPAKGILVKLGPFFSGTISEADHQLVGEIAFHFC